MIRKSICYIVIEEKTASKKLYRIVKGGNKSYCDANGLSFRLFKPN